VLEEMLTLDDGKGYYLVACILIGFMLALGGFYTGQALGFDQQEGTSTMMALAILLYIMVTMLTLIFGLVKFREPEHY
jgi:cation transporter-like permease